MLRPATAITLAGLVYLATIHTVTADGPLIQVDEAYVQADNPGWTIGNASIRYAIGTDASVRSIQDVQSGLEWQMSHGADNVISVNGQRLAIGGPATAFVRADVQEWSGGVRLDVQYFYAPGALTMTRSYACYAGSSVIETWTTFAEGSRQVTLSDLTSYTVSVRNGTLNWINGLQVPAEFNGPFSRQWGEMDDGDVFDLGSATRASEQVLPWFSIRHESTEFFGSVIWSGSWRVRLQRQGETIALQVGLPTFRTSLGAGGSLETPHAIFGLTSQAMPQPAAALRAFIDKGLRHGRAMQSYVTYNTWYAYGTFIDEPSLLAEMDMASSLGVEQFVVDAGWWVDGNPDDQFDFVHGWGNWQVDTDRFPNGLGSLADHAHDLGMRFGVWVEPERVDRRTLGQPGLAKERFLATSDGRYEPGVPNSESMSGQVCLVDTEAREWLLARLTAFLTDVHPDYVKWDNNLWVNCNRPGHGHGTEDGNFLHHRALAGMLDRLRELFPDLDIENCSSGGNRLSLDLLSRTDAAWVDDRTGPAAHVRHDLEGLFSFLPPAYLLTFSTSPVEAAEDRVSGIDYVMRSRMMGAFGLSWPLATLDDGARAELASQIALYKRIRPALQRGTPILLTAQAPDGPAPGWDVVQYLMAETGDCLLLGYNTADAPADAVVRPLGLRPDSWYDIESADQGSLGRTRGSDLMERGIGLQAADLAAGHVLFLHLDGGGS